MPGFVCHESWTLIWSEQKKFSSMACTHTHTIKLPTWKWLEKLGMNWLLSCPYISCIIRNTISNASCFMLHILWYNALLHESEIEKTKIRKKPFFCDGFTYFATIHTWIWVRNILKKTIPLSLVKSKNATKTNPLKLLILPDTGFSDQWIVSRSKKSFFFPPKSTWNDVFPFSQPKQAEKVHEQNLHFVLFIRISEFSKPFNRFASSKTNNNLWIQVNTQSFVKRPFIPSKNKHKTQLCVIFSECCNRLESWTLNIVNAGQCFCWKKEIFVPTIS